MLCTLPELGGKIRTARAPCIHVSVLPSPATWSCSPCTMNNERSELFPYLHNRSMHHSSTRGDFSCCVKRGHSRVLDFAILISMPEFDDGKRIRLAQNVGFLETLYGKQTEALFGPKRDEVTYIRTWQTYAKHQP